MITCPICKTEFCRNDAPNDHERVVTNTAELVLLLAQIRHWIKPRRNEPDGGTLYHEITEALAKLKTEV